MIDPNTGYVYETEDGDNAASTSSCPRAEDLKQGGELYMLKVVGWAGGRPARCPRRHHMERRVGEDRRSRGRRWRPRFEQGLARAARASAVSRAPGGRVDRLLPGTTGGNFLSPTPGRGEGQVFEYNPFNQTIKLIYNSPAAIDCENPDNITVTPRGGLLMCEDNSGATTNDAERMIGLTLDRENVHVRQEQHRAGPTSTNGVIPPATTARANGRAPATAPMASGCSSTSRRRASRSPSPVPGHKGPL